MKKMSTLFKKNKIHLVERKVNEENSWVFINGLPYLKLDGTSCLIKDGKIYRRYDAKIDLQTGKHKKPIPANAFACCKPDLITGHHPHWKLCLEEDVNDKFHLEALHKLDNPEDGTYELIGPKFQKNPENVESNMLVKHDSDDLKLNLINFTYDSIKAFLCNDDFNAEGIVFHEIDGDRKCKIRKCDFGVKRTGNKNTELNKIMEAK